MFLRGTNRKKDGKDHRYFSIVENRRLPGDKSVQRTVLYLGEIVSRRYDQYVVDSGGGVEGGYGMLEQAPSPQELELLRLPGAESAARAAGQHDRHCPHGRTLPAVPHKAAPTSGCSPP